MCNRPIVARAPGGGILLLLVILPAVAGIEVVRTFNSLARIRRHLGANACAECGYCLSGLAESPRWVTCPECGTLSPVGLGPSGQPCRSNLS